MAEFTEVCVCRGGGLELGEWEIPGSPPSVSNTDVT